MESRSDSEINMRNSLNLCNLCTPERGRALILPRISQISRISQIILNQPGRNTDREALCKAKNPPDCENIITIRRIVFLYRIKKRMSNEINKLICNYSFSSLLLRCVRDSNPWPPAWQAGILTSWTNAPKLRLSMLLLRNPRRSCFGVVPLLLRCKVKAYFPIVQIFCEKNFIFFHTIFVIYYQSTS